MIDETLKIKLEELKELLEQKEGEHASIDAKQNAIKIFLNSGYGALTNIWFRFFDLRLATSITGMGRLCIRGVADYVTDRVEGIDNIYTDTDSNFFSVEKVIKKRFGEREPSNEEGLIFIDKLNKAAISPRIVEYYERMTTACNASKNTFKMENELIGNKGIWTGKKKYAIRMLRKDKTVYLNETKLKVTGIEIVRTSTPQFCRDKLKRAFEILFETESYSDMMAYIDNVKSEFKKLPFVEVAFPRKVNGLEKYKNVIKSVPIQVRASLLYNDILKKKKIHRDYSVIHDGEPVKFCYIKEPNVFNSNVLACPNEKMPSEIHDQFLIDYDKQFEKTYLAPLQKIFDIMNWDLTGKSFSLEDFFSDED